MNNDTGPMDDDFDFQLTMAHLLDEAETHWRRAANKFEDICSLIDRLIETGSLKKITEEGNALFNDPHENPMRQPLNPLKKIIDEMEVKILEVIMNARVATLLQDRPDSTSYENKKIMVNILNEMLRDGDAAFCDPTTGQPSIIYTLPTRNGSGRYTFESRITKKRSGSIGSMNELLPFKLVKDIPRKIGSIEARKKQD